MKKIIIIIINRLNRRSGIVLFTRHQICRQDLLVNKSKLDEHKKFSDCFILTFLLDRGMQRVNWLQPRTIVCCIKLCFGSVQLSIVSLTEWLERL